MHDQPSTSRPAAWRRWLSPATTAIHPRGDDTWVASAARGRALALLAALCFGLNGSMAKLVLQAGMPADRLTQLRSTGAAACLLAIVVVRQPQALRVRREEIWVLVASGLCGVALVQFLYFVAIARLPVGVALLLEFTAPVLVALWTRFGFPTSRRRPVHVRVWAALVLVVAGLGVLAQVWEGLTLDGLGMLAGLASAAALAAFYLLGEHGVSGRDGLSFASLIFAVGALAWAILRPWWGFPNEVLGRTADGGLPVWLLAVGVVGVGTVLAYLLTFEALRHLSASDASVVATAEPLLAGLIAWVLLGEILTPFQLIGGAVVLAGILLAQTAPEAPDLPAIPDASPGRGGIDAAGGGWTGD